MERVIERRQFGIEPLQLRTTSDTTAHFRGIAYRIGRPNPVVDFLGEYLETVHHGAAARHLAGGSPIPLLLNHNAAGVPLAKWPGTLALRETSDGLLCESDLDLRSPSALDVAVAMERGDLCQMSYAFTARQQKWSNDHANRDIYDLDLWDCSIVTSPADVLTTATIVRSDSGDSLARAYALVEWADTEERAGRKISGKHLELIRKARAALATAGKHLATLSKANAANNAPQAGGSSGLSDGGPGGAGQNSGIGANADGMGPRSVPANVAAARRDLDALKQRVQDDLYVAQIERGGPVQLPADYVPSPSAVSRIATIERMRRVATDPLSRAREIRDQVAQRRRVRGTR